MKTNLLTLLLLSTGLTASAQWVNQPITFADPAATAFLVEALSPSTVWTATGNILVEDLYIKSQVALSTNGGQTWDVRSLPLDADREEAVISLSAVNATTAWVITSFGLGGGNDRVLKTTDGGLNWTAQGTGVVFTDPRSFADHVVFFSPTEGLLVGDSPEEGGPPELYRTTNGGLNWTAVSAPASLEVGGFSALPPAVVGNNIWVGTEFGGIYHSADRGQTWMLIQVAQRQGELVQVIFRDAQNGLVRYLDPLNVDNRLFRTTDGGQSWNRVLYSGPLRNISLGAVPGTGNYISVGAGPGGNGRGSSYSRDQGQTWINLESQLNHFVVDFVSPTVGWSSGFQGSVANPRGNGLNKFGSTVLGLRGTDAALQAGLRVVPNPAEGGRSSLHVAQPFGAAAQVRVLDVTGRLVETYTWTGNVPLELDLSREKAGLYLLEVSSKAGLARQKLQVQ